jgi:hypothetical protein
MSTRILFLTGGLGNQLFQYSAFNAYAAKSKLVIDLVNGNPRVNGSEIPELLDFELTNGIEFHTRRMPLITRKALGYSLRSHLNPVGVEKSVFWRWTSRLCTSVLASIHYRKVLIVQVLSDLGDDPKFRVNRGNSLFLGYFQSIRWAKSLEMTLRIREQVTSDLVQRYRELSETELPLIVHVRLGDYVSEGGFGIPSQDYYAEALKEMLGTGKYKKIWLFSDEPSRALELLAPHLNFEHRIINEPGASSAETLEIMRFGSGYIIGNSTFSWWGAFTSHSESPRVKYPYPWFKDVNPPKNLTPEGWEPLNARF